MACSPKKIDSYSLIAMRFFFKEQKNSSILQFWVSRYIVVIENRISIMFSHCLSFFPLFFFPLFLFPTLIPFFCPPLSFFLAILCAVFNTINICAFVICISDKIVKLVSIWLPRSQQRPIQPIQIIGYRGVGLSIGK